MAGQGSGWFDEGDGLFPSPDPDTLVEADRFAREIERRRRGEISEEEFRRFRLNNGIYGIRGQRDIQMIRVKIPFGSLTARQLQRLAAIADDFSTGRGHITTRQCIQFHWIPLERIPDVMRQLAEVGLTSREACGNTVRNVTGCPLAGICREEAFDIRPYAAAFVRHFLRHPAYQNMPRKFKTSFSGCGRDCSGSGFHDIGAVAAVRTENGRTVRGFRVWVGGGLGAIPRPAHLLEEFTPADQLLVTAEAVMRVFDRLGNRQDLHRARLKFLIESLGIEEFRRLVFQERRTLAAVRPGAPPPPIAPVADEVAAAPEASPAVPPRAEGSEDYRRWLATNVVAQKQPGYYAAYVTVPGGDLTSEQMRGLARIAKRYSRGVVQTTATQDALFRWVRGEDLPDLYADLAALGLGLPGATCVMNVTSCPGADTCNLAVTHSHRLGLELARQLAARPEYGLAEDLKGIDIKVSGCPNSCGQHHIAAIGLYGNARKVNGRQVPYYQILLGGRLTEGETEFGRPVLRVPAKRAPEAIFRILDLYRAERREGEPFHAWVQRLAASEGEGDLEAAEE